MNFSPRLHSTEMQAKAKPHLVFTKKDLFLGSLSRSLFLCRNKFGFQLPAKLAFVADNHPIFTLLFLPERDTYFHDQYKPKTQHFFSNLKYRREGLKKGFLVRPMPFEFS